MASYYQLLTGQYEDVCCNRYKPGDIIESQSDLIAAFSTRRFRKLSVQQAAELGCPEAQAELKDGKGTTPKHGDVTESFPKAKEKGLQVYRLPDGKYQVSDADNVVLSEPLKSRIAVHQFVKGYEKAV